MVNNLLDINKQFQAINQFIAATANQYRGLTEINQEVMNIAALLNTRRLTLQTFSQFPLLSEGLKNFFNTHSDLRQFYNSKISDLPFHLASTLTKHPSTLVFKANSAVGQSEARYELSSTQSILIGRDLQHQNDAKLMHIPLPMYKMVSGRHAEIQPVASIDLKTTAHTPQLAAIGISSPPTEGRHYEIPTQF